MILNKKLIDRCLTSVKEKGRTLDYYLIKNLFDCQDINLIEELLKYQNEDGGFGHGLEPDARLPQSSVLCTDEAVLILQEISDYTLKEVVIKDIVNYYEKVYIQEKQAWELVPPEVDNYPRAIWWNYSGVGNFTYGNPNPQIIGFLYKYRMFINKLDIDYLVNKVIKYIQTDFVNESSKHNILSCLMFYSYLNEEEKLLIYPNLQAAIDHELENDKWDEYCLQPYEVCLISKDFLVGKEELLNRNLDYNKAKLEKGLIMPNWNWNQFEKEFENAKFEWAGYLTFTILKALHI